MNPKTLLARTARLMPAGVPRYVRCYDNGGTSAPGGTIDRYTVLFTGRNSGQRIDRNGHRLFQCLAMNAAPFHPQGFGQHCESYGSAGNGKRIPFASLPEDCRKLVLRDYREIWNLNPAEAA